MIETDETVTSIFDPVNGAGALQFSIFIVPDPESILLNNELASLLEGRHHNCNFNVTKNYAGATCLDDGKNVSWRYWLFLKEDRVFFASYNCNKEYIDKERMTINQIINSAFSTKT